MYIGALILLIRDPNLSTDTNFHLNSILIPNNVQKNMSLHNFIWSPEQQPPCFCIGKWPSVVTVIIKAATPTVSVTALLHWPSSQHATSVSWEAYMQNTSTNDGSTTWSLLAGFNSLPYQITPSPLGITSM